MGWGNVAILSNTGFFACKKKVFKIYANLMMLFKIIIIIMYFHL